MNYVYDTNILVLKIRQHQAMEQFETDRAADTNQLKIISIVTKAEMESSPFNSAGKMQNNKNSGNCLTTS